jgi:branched-chain amino acid transport system permease protein
MLIMLIQVVLNGLIKGLIYALIASGFSFIYGQANILFFALGQIYMLGAVLVYVLMVLLGMHYLPAVALAFLALGLFGIILERGMFRPLTRIEGSNALTYALASMVLGMFIVGITQEAFGERPKGVENPFQGTIEFFGVFAAIDKIAVVLVSVGVLVALSLFFKYARSGRAIRAVAQDDEAAQLAGININRTKALTFFLALGVTGAAGGLIAPLFYTEVGMGAPVLMTTLIVVVFGGLGSFSGAIAGGLAFGMIESFGQTYIGGVSTIISFGILILLLIFRPQGLLGRG